MPEGNIPPKLEGLKITNWYKYVAYVAGVILILSFFLPSQIATSKLLNFSVVSIGIALFPVLGILAYAGLFYLIKDKLKRARANLITHASS
ncbi:MAG: hypothetical protein ABSB40_00025 [Nitrososphaeria archaeon]|jgi:xanthine/uracil permease